MCIYLPHHKHRRDKVQTKTTFRRVPSKYLEKLALVLRKQPTFHHAITSFPLKWCWRRGAQKFSTDDISLPRSGWCFWLIEAISPTHNESEAHTIYFDVVFKNRNHFPCNIIDNNRVKKENIPVSFNSPQYPFRPILCPQNSLVPLPS